MQHHENLKDDGSGPLQTKKIVQRLHQYATSGESYVKDESKGIN